MKKSSLFLLFFSLLLFPLHAETNMRPSKQDVQKYIALMGDADFEVRSNAQKKLKQWSEHHPRFLLVQLAEAYGKAEDVEIEIRLRELLKPLARLYLHAEPRGYLGVHLGTERVGNEVTVVILRKVLPGQAADAAGLKDNDMILLMNGESMDDIGGQGGLTERISNTMPGSVLELAVKRGDKEFLARVIVGLRPMNARERAATVGSFEAQYLAWLESLRPDRTFNGMPVGHYPMEEKEAGKASEL